MQFKDKAFCHWDLVRFFPEKLLTKEDGNPLTLSVITNHNRELMIFLGKINTGFEVRVYKHKPENKYVPHEFDKGIESYEENDDYATFIFKHYYDARDFVEMLGYVHEEYRIRPNPKKIDS